MTNKKEEKNGLIGSRVLIGHVANDGGGVSQSYRQQQSKLSSAAVATVNSSVL